MQYAPILTDKKVYYQDQFWGYAKWYDLLFDLKNDHAKSIIPLFESNNSYAKWHDLFLIWKMVMQNRLYLYLNRKMIM